MRRFVIFTVCLLAASVLTATEAAAQRGDASAEIELIADLMELEPGDVGADIGAGGGRYSARLAARVQPGGHWYANEVSERGLRRMREHFADDEHVTVVAGAHDSTNLPTDCCDAAMLRVVYHHLRNPLVMAEDFKRLLKPGGLLVIIENDPQRGDNAEGVPDNRSGMGIDREIVIDELTGAGFTRQRLVDDLDRLDYAIVFRAPGG